MTKKIVSKQSSDLEDEDGVTVVNWCGVCISLFFIFLALFCVWAIAVGCGFYMIELDVGEAKSNSVITKKDVGGQAPMLSDDGRTLYVVSEEGLAAANDCILKNPQIPIERIVYRKQGHNATVHVYPVHREALLAAQQGLDVPALVGAGIFMVLFTSYLCYLVQTLKPAADDLNRLSWNDTDLEDSDLEFNIEYSPERKPKFNKEREKAVMKDELINLLEV